MVTASTYDTILTGPTTEVARECDGIVSDARWTWIRRSLSGEVVSFALIQGTTLSIGDEPAFQSDRTVNCAVGRQEPDGWHVDIQGPERWSTMTSSSGDTRIEERCAASVE